jgi:hypothetical protein
VTKMELEFGYQLSRSNSQSRVLMTLPEGKGISVVKTIWNLNPSLASFTMSVLLLLLLWFGLEGFFLGGGMFCF